MILGETVSIDGGALVVILVILLAFLVATCALVVMAFVWARKAGRGSRPALVAWLAVAAVELVLAATVVPSTIDGAVNWWGVLAAAALGGQVLRYVRARREVPPGGDGAGPLS